MADTFPTVWVPYPKGDPHEGKEYGPFIFCCEACRLAYCLTFLKPRGLDWTFKTIEMPGWDGKGCDQCNGEKKAPTELFAEMYAKYLSPRKD